MEKAVKEIPWHLGYIRKIFWKWEDFQSVREDEEFLALLEE